MLLEEQPALRCFHDCEMLRKLPKLVYIAIGEFCSTIRIAILDRDMNQTVLASSVNDGIFFKGIAVIEGILLMIVA